MVATVTELRTSSAAVEYYEKDGYYAKNDPEHRKASFWHGEAALELGLRGHVHPKRFESVLSGEVPGTDIRLGRKVDGEHVHRPGWDITLSAPKSVSLQALVSGDRRVIRAHDRAVRDTLDWVERELLQTRGWDPATGSRPRIQAHGMVCAGFRHLTSRNLDPQLHTHCIVANMTRLASGAWRSVEPTLIRRNQKLIGAYYRNELATRLTGLGYAVAPKLIGRVPGFELAGYGQEYLDAFSGRRREILRYLEDRNLPYTAAAAQMAALGTRRQKTEAGLDELVPAWRERAGSLGLHVEPAALRPPRPIDPETGCVIPFPKPARDPYSVNETRRRNRAPALPGMPAPVVPLHPQAAKPGLPVHAPQQLLPAPEKTPVEVVSRAVYHLEERRTVIPRGEIRALALGHAPGRFQLQEIDKAIDRLCREGELVEARSGGPDTAYVTDRAIRSERRMLALMRAGRGKALPLSDAASPGAEQAMSGLTGGQREAVHLILESADTVVGVQGHAGTGKTAMLRTVASLLGEDDRRNMDGNRIGNGIMGLAPSSAAARVLRREAGIETRTLQWFLLRHENLSDPAFLARARGQFRGKVLAVDESSMIGTVQMESLLRIAKTLEVSRVVLVGDTRQLRAVDAGQPFRVLQKARMATVVMDEVLRQREPVLATATGAVREGDPRTAILGLGSRVFEAPPDRLGNTVAERWLALPHEDRARTTLLAPTHLIRGDINRRVREGLLEEGVLHGKALVIQRLVDQRLTRAEASDPGSYREGDTVVFHRNAYGCAANDVCMVSAVRGGPESIGVPGVSSEVGKNEAGKNAVRIELIHPDGRPRSFRPSGNAARNLGLYDTAEIELRAGDRIRWTRNRKAPPARFGRERMPDIVNGDLATVVEIGPRVVKFRSDGGRTYSISRNDPQLRHIDHAYSFTVHAAQGLTSPRVIGVLEAGGRTDQEMFYVELSRASEEFELVVDDRELVAERLAAQSGIDDGALEAVGAGLAAPVVDPELFARLQGEWRAIQRQADEEGSLPCHVDGYEDTVAGLAALGMTEDLPADMRDFVDGVIEEHDAYQAREEHIRDLAGNLGGHWRQWPELCWKASSEGVEPVALEEYEPWRDEGDRLLAEARDLLADQGEDGRHLSSMDGVRPGIESSLARLEDMRTARDLERFEQGWGELVRESGITGVPEIHLSGYAEVAELGAHLEDAAGLDEGQPGTIDEWRETAGHQTELAARVVSLPEEAAELLVKMKEDSGGDLGGAYDAPDDSRKTECRDLITESREMLGPDSMYAPHLDAMAGSREKIGETADLLDGALLKADIATFHGLSRAVTEWAAETGGLAMDAPDCAELVELAGALDGRGGTPPEIRQEAGEWVDTVAQMGRDRTWVDSIVRDIRRLDREWSPPETPAGESGGTGSAAAFDAWQHQAEQVSAEVIRLGVGLSPESLDAHARACGTSAERLDNGVGKIRQRLAERKTLPEYAAWQKEHDGFLKDKDELPNHPERILRKAWRERGENLLENGRELCGRADKTGSAELAGARESVAVGVERIESALLAYELPAFDRLDGSVMAASGKSGGLPPDQPGYPALIGLSRALVRRDGVSPDTMDRAIAWIGKDTEWKEVRAEVKMFVKLVGEAGVRTREHAAECDARDRLVPAPTTVRMDAVQVDMKARELEKMDAGELRTHVRAAGGDPDAINAAVGEIRDWIAVDDAAQKMAGREDHIRALHENREALRGSVGKAGPTLPWKPGDPLVPGDRLHWTEYGTGTWKTEAIVLSVSYEGKGPGLGKVNSLIVEQFHGDAPASGDSGDRRVLGSWHLEEAAEGAGVRRARWPDESVRKMECTRQMPEADAVYGIDCRDSLLPGDRVRFNPGTGTREFDVDGGHRDAPLIEAVVGKVEVGEDPGEDMITLRVTASWGPDKPPAPGTVITKERSEIAARGMYRMPWKDETRRAELDKAFTERSRARRKELSRGRGGFSM